VIKIANIVFISNNENWEIIEEKNIMGLGGRGLEILPKIKKGDICAIYIKGKMVFKAIYEITLEKYTRKVKWKNGSYPEIITLNPIKIAKKPLNIKEIISELKFIKNKENWMVYFRFPKFIPEEDLELIQNRMK
jgi:predicted RNA-binding protein